MDTYIVTWSRPFRQLFSTYLITRYEWPDPEARDITHILNFSKMGQSAAELFKNSDLTIRNSSPVRHLGFDRK